MEDKLIAVTSMLFVFSLITERFANFLKLWLPEDLDLLQLIPSRETENYRTAKAIDSMDKRKTSGLLKAYRKPVTNKKGTIVDKKFLFVGNLKTEAKSDFDEKQREAKILMINIFCGFVVALFVKIDVIYIFKHMSDSDIKFDQLVGWRACNLAWSNIVGIPLTGFFLSFGSKFWHDLVDLLYETKRLKSRATDPDIINAGSSAMIVKNIEEKNKVVEVLRKNLDYFRAFPGFVEAKVEKNHSPAASFGYCIDVYLDDINLLPTDVPKSILEPESGKEIIIDYLDAVSVAMAVGEGGRITNADRKGFGSLGALVWKLEESPGIQYILSCYHVLKTDDHDFFNFTAVKNKDDIKNAKSGDTIAILKHGEINNLFDVGLAQIEDPLEVVDENRFTRTREVTSLDEDARTSVRIKGAVTKTETIAFIHEVERDPLIVKYGTRTNTFDGLFVVSTMRGGKLVSPAAEGDSGSIIYTAQGEALGMILAVNKKYTFAMPMNGIMDHLGLQFV